MSKEETTPEQDELILFLAIISKTFSDNKQEPISLPYSTFKPLSFKRVNELMDRFNGSKTFVLTNRPKTEKDKTPYELELTQHQKSEYKKMIKDMKHLRDMQMLMIYWSKYV